MRECITPVALFSRRIVRFDSKNRALYIGIVSAIFVHFLAQRVRCGV